MQHHSTAAEFQDLLKAGRDFYERYVRIPKQHPLAREQWERARLKMEFLLVDQYLGSKHNAKLISDSEMAEIEAAGLYVLHAADNLDDDNPPLNPVTKQTLNILASKITALHPEFAAELAELRKTVQSKTQYRS